MATIHHASLNPRYSMFGVSLCSIKHNQNTTTDKEKVTCLRCAKILGITPAAKPESKNVKGTCACCFSQQKTQTTAAKSSGTMFHHGYQRPGNGYIEGACPGHDFLPYEKSCEGTKYMLERAKSALENTIAHIEHLKTTDKVTTYVFAGYESIIPKRVEKNVFVTLVKGEAPVTVERPRYCPSSITLTFENVRDEQLSEQETRKGHIAYDIKFYEKKIAEWKEN